MQIEQITYQLTWQIRHEVMWPNEPPEFVRLAEDPNGIHYGVFDKNRLCSVVSVFLDQDRAQFRKLATRVEFQKRGYASALLTYIFKDLPTYGASKVWCNARIEHLDFYSKFGLKDTGTRFKRKNLEYAIMEMTIKHA